MNVVLYRKRQKLDYSDISNYRQQNGTRQRKMKRHQQRIQPETYTVLKIAHSALGGLKESDAISENAVLGSLPFPRQICQVRNLYIEACVCIPRSSSNSHNLLNRCRWACLSLIAKSYVTLVVFKYECHWTNSTRNRIYKCISLIALAWLVTSP